MQQFCIDSRSVTAGDYFIAIDCPGVILHVHDAVRRGASIIFVDACKRSMLPPDLRGDARICYVDNARLFVSHVYRNLHPRQPEYLVAVTGTNGKTSTVRFLEHIWSYCGYRAGSNGTIGLSVDCNPVTNDAKNTTPGPQDFYIMLQELADQSVQRFVFEASSHAIEQNRFRYADVSSVGITNITRDHVFYHGDYDRYRIAKLQLLDYLSDDQYAVVWRDDESLFEDVSVRHGNVIWYGFHKNADVRAENIVCNRNSIEFDICIDGITRSVSVNLVGEYNVKNILCACAFAINSGCSADDVCDAIATLQVVPGRCEFITQYNGASIYVDFAHNDDGLYNCLSTLKSICKDCGRLLCVFGVSDKDAVDKMGKMGRVANEYCEYAIVTDDNLNDESKRDYINERICRELDPDRHTLCTNREEAISMAISMLRPGDILVVSGKGHEQFQRIGDRVTRFNDGDKIREIVGRLLSC